MIIGYIAAIMIMAFAIYCAGDSVIRRRAAIRDYGMKPKELLGYSWASKQILSKYHALPADHKPYSNITHMLRALDTKYGVDSVDKHYSKQTSAYDGWITRQTWACDCYGAKDKDIHEYLVLHNAMVEVSTALAHQAHALEVANVAGGLDAVKELTESLREEKKLIQDTTKELTAN